MAGNILHFILFAFKDCRNTSYTFDQELQAYRLADFNPFPRFDASPADQTFENNAQFLLWPQCFQLFSVNVPTIHNRDFLYFLVDIFKAVCCRFAVCGNGLTCVQSI